MSMLLTPLTSIPDVKPGDCISDFISDGLKNHEITLEDNDILVVTQKIISKRVPCAPCGLKGKCDNEHICMKNISIDDVWPEIDKLLSYKLRKNMRG